MGQNTNYSVCKPDEDLLYKKPLTSVIANKGYVTKYWVELLFIDQILIFHYKLQINSLKILQCDFLDFFLILFCLSQFKCTNNENYRPLSSF